MFLAKVHGAPREVVEAPERLVKHVVMHKRLPKDDQGRRFQY